MATKLTKMKLAKLAAYGGLIGVGGGIIAWGEYKRRQPTVIVLNLAGSRGRRTGEISSIRQMARDLAELSGRRPEEISFIQKIDRDLAESRQMKEIRNKSLIWQMARYNNYQGLKAVCLKINYPGGSPLQSLLLADKIHEFSSEKGVPVYAFVEDVATSGEYFLAFGAKEIYAKESSIIESIGAKQTFGLKEIIKSWGLDNVKRKPIIEKQIVGPVAGVREEELDAARTERVPSNIHRHFISFIKESRGDRLKGKEDQLSSGDSWTAKEALELGLIDGVENDMVAFLKRKFGDTVQIEQISAQEYHNRKRNSDDNLFRLEAPRKGH